MKIVLTGGGTAGHVMPHLALLNDLRKHFNEIHYFGSKDGIEKTIIANYDFVKYHEITTVKLRRSLSLKNLTIPFKLLAGIKQCKKLLKEIKPNVIFSKGGFVAVPVCLAAKKLNIPIISHESDFSLGLANKIIYKKCNVMCCSFEKTAEYGSKCVHTGSAIRKSLLQGNKEEAIKEFGLNKTLPTICITGGSLGATKLNQMICEIKNQLLKNFNIIHLCGKNKKINHTNQNTNGKYVQIEFATNPANIFACCDLVVCRAGSNTIFEFLALKKPMLLLPLSKKASRGDQILNSQYFKEKGFADYVLDEDLTEAHLLEKIEKLQKDKNYYITNMRNSTFQLGNNKILNQILKEKK